MQVFEQQQGNQGCPNLNPQGILTGADKGFDFEMLLQGFDKDLNLPSVFIYIGDRGCPEGKVVGQ